MSTFLTDLCEQARRRCHEAKQIVALESVVERARDLGPPPPLKLDERGFDLIAEVKKSSPALGVLSEESDIDLIDRAGAYAEAGAAAVSVLTEPTRFKGKLRHLETISAALRPQGVPVMRKDFLVDEYQIWEAAAAGAGGVLLILRVLDDRTVMSMIEAAAQNRMFVLLEAFDRNDLLRAQPFSRCHDRILVGLNSRNLATLDVDKNRLHELADDFPPQCLRVAESGIATPDDVVSVRRDGYELALVGTVLMQQSRPSRLIRAMLAAGRETQPE